METEVLWNILAKPEDAKYAFTLNAQSLVDQSPQSGLFRALLAANGNEQNVQHAAVRFNPSVLYRLIHAPGSLPVVTAGQIYQFEEPLANGTFKKTVSKSEFDSHLYEPVDIKPVEHEVHSSTRPDVNEEDEDAVNQDIDAAEGKEKESFLFEEANYEPVAYVTEVEDAEVVQSPSAQREADEPTYSNPWAEQPEPAGETASTHHFEPVAQHFQPQQPIAETHFVPEQQPVAEVPQSAPQPEPVPEAPAPQVQQELIPLSEQTEYFHQDIDDEIYDEIVSIDDIGMEFINSYKPSDYGVEEEKVNSAQHFVFDREFSPPAENRNQTESAYNQPAQNYAHPEEIEDIHPYVPPVIVPANEVMVIKRGVSQYDDEKLPYTFMWWLDKTRQEHSGTYAYQPYSKDHKQQQYQQQNPDVKINTDTASGRDLLDELQIQYVENIYTLNAVDDLERRMQPKGDESQRKEDKIIERFIKTEPHIKPPNEKLDNENKAKRSSEDGDELITETLARIYSEQMLYSKAIAAYKKLMLKYPEKSLYFAGQIEQLEKKPN